MERVAPPQVLVADDQADVREALRLLLKGEGFAVETVDSVDGALSLFAKRSFDCALVDLNYARDTTSGAEGLDLVSRVRSLDATLPVVVMTAWGTIDLAVEAMRRGARDFVQKPWDNDRLLATLRTQTELARALRRGDRLEAAERARQEGGRALIARSAAMAPVLGMIERIGPSVDWRLSRPVLARSSVCRSAHGSGLRNRIRCPQRGRGPTQVPLRAVHRGRRCDCGALRTAVVGVVLGPGPLRLLEHRRKSRETHPSGRARLRRYTQIVEFLALEGGSQA